MNPAEATASFPGARDASTGSATNAAQSSTLQATAANEMDRSTLIVAPPSRQVSRHRTQRSDAMIPRPRVGALSRHWPPSRPRHRRDHAIP